MRASILTLVALAASPVAGRLQLYQYGLNSTATLSETCSDALKTPLDCEPYLFSLATTGYYGPIGNDSFQDSLCRTSCGTSLSAYHSNVLTACANDPQPWDGIPAVWMGDILWATYNRTCLTGEAGDYCTSKIGEIRSTLGDTDTSLTALPKEQLCSSCVLALIQQMQATAYSNYNKNLVNDWVEIQKICDTGPLPTKVQPPAANVTSFVPGADHSDPTNTSCLSDNFYTVKAGDSIRAIAETLGVPTGPLTILNGIFPDGSNLLQGQVLCLPRKCEIYKVQQGDTCVSIASANNISIGNIINYNPTINRACSNLIAGTNICIGPSGSQYTPTTIPGATATKTNQYATSTVIPSGPTASGTTEECGKYYEVVTGDSCERISLQHSISVELFMAINPSIGEDCTSLAPGVYYCVLPTRSWNATISGSFPPKTTSAYVTAPAPTPTGTTPKCYLWHTVQKGDQCTTLQSVYGISFSRLRTWNPQLNQDCSNLLLGAAYCVKGDSGTVPTPTSATATPTTVAPPGPTQQEISANCNRWVMQKDGIFCYSMAMNAGITLDQLYKWNPALNGDCSGLWTGYAYCIGVSG